MDKEEQLGCVLHLVVRKRAVCLCVEVCGCAHWVFVVGKQCPAMCARPSPE